MRQALAQSRLGVCIVGMTQLMLRVHQPDPPGLIHDDPRLLPPLARVVPFPGVFAHNRRFVHSRPTADWWKGAIPVNVGAVSPTVHPPAPPVPVVLTLVEDPELSANAERVAAAVGARAVTAVAPSRRNWLAAAAVILDEAAALRCARAGMPRRDGVLLIGPDQPSTSMWTAAIDIGAESVCALPEQEATLVRHVAESAERGAPGARNGRVLAVTAGPGGGGASVFSAALARCAGEALLVDLDPCGGGIDLLLGGESVPGLRWPDLRLHGGRLSWTALREALPRQRDISFLSGTRTFHDIDAGAVEAVVDAGRRGGTTVVCDVPRQPAPAAVSAVQSADLAIIVSSCDVRGIAATAAVAAIVRTLNPNLGLVVRGPAPGGLRAVEVADVAGVPLLVAMRPEPMLGARLEHGGLRLRNRSPLARAAQTVLAMVEHGNGGRDS